MWPGENKLSGKLDIAHIATKNPKVKEGAKYFQISSKKDLFHRCQGGLSHSPELGVDNK